MNARPFLYGFTPLLLMIPGASRVEPDGHSVKVLRNSVKEPNLKGHWPVWSRYRSLYPDE